jgi:N-acetylmuramoyl-L-alanine amidase
MLSAPFVTAQDVPPATPDASVPVAPPPATSTIDALLNQPGVLTPRPTATFIPQVPPGFLQAGNTAIVLEGPLNVRDQPSVRDGQVIVQLEKGEDVTVLQLSPDLNWALVDTRGPAFVQGWVSTDFLRQQGEFIPFEATSEPGQPNTEFVLRATETVNIRANPVLFSPRVGILAAGTDAVIIGRKSTYQWWKIRTEDGTVGWVSSIYVYVVTPAAYQQAPVLVD